MHSGRPFTPAVIGEVQEGSAAAEAGLLPGDRIVAVEAEPLASFEQLQGIVRKEDFGEGYSRYELATERVHHHARCRQCGAAW